MILRTSALALLLTALSIPAAISKTLCTAFADAATGKVLKQEGACDTRVFAASTFKIAISLMGYDSGFLTTTHEPALPFKKGYPSWIASWKATTDPTSWMKNSVVWYSQQVTKYLGEKRFQRYVSAFHYGNEDVSGDPGKRNGLSRSWLSSSLKISPLEQLAFLGRLVNRQLPVTPHAYEMTDQITALGTLPNGWEVHGKTGAGAPHNADGSLANDRAYGWFVGWATKDGRTLVFARLIQNEKKEAVSPGLRTREAMMRELPAMLDSL
jgi:beta-lactamase class D/beta-lactamase class D OXA-42